MCSLDELFGVCASGHNWLQLEEEHAVLLMTTQAHNLPSGSKESRGGGEFSPMDSAQMATDALSFLRFVAGGMFALLTFTGVLVTTT